MLTTRERKVHILILRQIGMVRVLLLARTHLLLHLVDLALRTQRWAKILESSDFPEHSRERHARHR